MRRRAPGETAKPSLRRSAVLFSLGRLGLFIASALLLWSGAGAAGYSLNGFPLLLAALVLSSVAGVFLFSRQRLQFAEALADKRLAKIEELTARRARLDDDGA
ncbi:MAG: hypothetical protein JWO12_332 [Frankiales bacterium]|nr:hypothetical protein [Frankiales bacterium]